MNEEAWMIVDVDFDAWGINAVTAIEQFYDADCLGPVCGSLTSSPEDPAECTNGIFDVMVSTFESLPNLDEAPRVGTPAAGDVAVVLYPGDKWISFNHEGSFVRFGGKTSKKFGQIAVRIKELEENDGEFSVTVRFHTACEEDAATTSTFAGYLWAAANGEPLINDLPVLQTRTGRLQIPSVNALLARDKVDSIHVLSAGIIGRDYLTEATLYKVNSIGARTVLASWEPPRNLWNQPSLSPVSLELKAGEFLEWTCSYASTEVAEDSVDEVPATIESGDLLSNYACDVALVFVNSRCGAAYFDPENPTPADCEDPLFVAEDEEEVEPTTLLVYDYLFRGGDCSDGSQWEAHPYSCTDQYTGGQCAFCVGRANNKESRLCFDREGIDCQVLFESPERVSFCNMEFECPASTLSLSFALILAFVAFLFN